MIVHSEYDPEPIAHDGFGAPLYAHQTGETTDPTAAERTCAGCGSTLREVQGLWTCDHQTCPGNLARRFGLTDCGTIRCDRCDECANDVDPNDAAPSCGAHILCVPCFTTADFRCRECRRVWAEIEAGHAEDAAYATWREGA